MTVGDLKRRQKAAHGVIASQTTTQEEKDNAKADQRLVERYLDGIETKKELDLKGAMSAAAAVIGDVNSSQSEKDAAARSRDRAEKELGRIEAARDMLPAGSFSLGRTQMAVWFFLVIAAFVFISMSLGQYLNLISASVLVLLGISGATGLAAIQIAPDQGAARPSRNFVRDILCDADGPQLQRIQAVAWTLVLGGIFAWVAARDYRLVAFDTNLLLLMGIASSLYLGFKPKER